MDEMQRQFDALKGSIREKGPDIIREEAQALSDAQRAALQSQLQSSDNSGDLEASCRVTDGRHPLEVFVEAGGEATTREVRAGSGVDYDYANAFEFGTSRQPARPFFFNTYRARRDQMRRNIETKVAKL